MFAAPAPHETRRSSLLHQQTAFIILLYSSTKGISYKRAYPTETTPTVRRHDRITGGGDCGGGELAAEAALEEASAAEAAVAVMRGRGDPHRAAPPAAPVEEVGEEEEPS